MNLTLGASAPGGPSADQGPERPPRSGSSPKDGDRRGCARPLNAHSHIGAIEAVVSRLVLVAVAYLAVRVLRHALAQASAHTIVPTRTRSPPKAPSLLEEIEREFAPARPPAKAPPASSRHVALLISAAPSVRVRTEADNRALARWLLDRQHQGLRTTGGDVEQHHPLL